MGGARDAGLQVCFLGEGVHGSRGEQQWVEGHGLADDR